MRRSHPLRSSLLIVVLFAASFLAIRETALLPDGKLHLHVLDVGQGDAILLITPSGKQVLIDGGPDLSALTYLGTYFPFFDRTIELLVLTHADADHITALPAILERYSVERILLNGAARHSGSFDRLLLRLQENGTSIMIADPAIDIDMGDGLTLDIVWPSIDDLSEFPQANNLSVTVRALYKEHAILLTGDIETKAEQAIVKAGTDIASTVIKVPHHGSRTSSSTGFLLAVHPTMALISAGRGNRFGHPHTEVTDRFRTLGIPLIITAEEGTLSMVFE